MEPNPSCASPHFRRQPHEFPYSAGGRRTRRAVTLSDLLIGEGYAVDIAVDGPTGLQRAVAEPFDLVILDVMLPGKNGFDVCRDLRQQGKDMAVMMLTAKSQLTDRVVGLELGADDYVAKPFEPAELLARVEALLRRVKKKSCLP